VKTHRYTKLLVAASLLALLCFVYQGCGLIYIQGISAGYSKDDLLADHDFHWVKDSCASSDIYFEAGSWAAHNIAFVKSNADSALVHILRLIAQTRFPHRLNYFIVDNRPRMNALIGLQTNGIAFARELVICAVANDTVRALGAHEMFHVVTMNAWGSTADWVNEGMAVYSDDQWRMQGLHALAHYLQQHRKLPSLEQLTKEFRQGNSLLTYPAAGSFVKFLYERFGRSEIELLWKQGFAAFCKSVQRSESELQYQWHNTISEFNTDSVHYAIPE
jgi:hypothetical protein